MKVTKIIVPNIYPIIESAMKKNNTSYKKNVEKFIKIRSSDLYDILPIHRIPFGTEDANDFFMSIKVDKRAITEQLSKTYYWNMDFNPRAAKDEFTIAMMMVIRYFLESNKDKDAEIAAIYLAFSGKFYPSIHSQKFPIPPEKYRHIMEYVLNNNMTNKFDIKREGSVLGAIRSLCRTWLSTYKSKFHSADDEDIADIIQQLHGRIKSLLGNIASAYYDAYERRDVYLTYSSDSTEQDSFRMADSDSLSAERAVENSINWITTKGVDYRLCKHASDRNVTTDEIKNIIESIQENNDNLILIRELLSLLVYDYFAHSKEKDVRSYEFIRHSIVAKPNSKDKNVVRIKEIVENWLDENSPQYRKRKSRPDTKSSYNKSILTYYALVINTANK